MNISVVGLGKLGAPFAAWIASKGYKVWGVDVNGTVGLELVMGKAPVEETGLQEMLDDIKSGESGKILYTPSISRAVKMTDITFIVVPTPSKEGGSFDLKYVRDVARQIGLALRYKDTYHLVVITSTVMPGHTDLVASCIEKLSGKVCGEDFGLCYNPEFIALGSVLHDLERPDFVLIGESDERAGACLETLYRTELFGDRDQYGIRPFVCHRTNFVNAEIAKLALNCYVTMKISFANEVGMICEQVEGADADQVLGAIGKDSRIGSKYLKAGGPFGGPCFPRDNRAFQKVLNRYSFARLSREVETVNAWVTQRIVDLIREYTRPGDTVGILGMAYKPGTSVTEESLGVALEKAVGQMKGRELMWYDPLVPHSIPLGLLIRTADMLVVTLPTEEFKNLDCSQFKGQVILDPWRTLSSETIPSCVRHIPMGRYHGDNEL